MATPAEVRHSAPGGGGAPVGGVVGAGGGRVDGEKAWVTRMIVTITPSTQPTATRPSRSRRPLPGRGDGAVMRPLPAVSGSSGQLLLEMVGQAKGERHHRECRVGASIRREHRAAGHVE